MPRISKNIPTARGAGKVTHSELGESKKLLLTLPVATHAALVVFAAGAGKSMTKYAEELMIEAVRREAQGGEGMRSVELAIDAVLGE